MLLRRKKKKLEKKLGRITNASAAFLKRELSYLIGGKN